MFTSGLFLRLWREQRERCEHHITRIAEIWRHALEPVRSCGNGLLGSEKRTRGRTGAKKGVIIVALSGPLLKVWVLWYSLATI